MAAPDIHRIVASHGLGDSAATWTALVARLADVAPGVAVDTWDLAAHGSAPPPPSESYGLDDAMAELDAVVGTGAAPAVLLGHSLGGYLSLRYTLTNPENVEGLVLIATGPGYRSDVRRAEWNAYLERAAGPMGLPAGVEVVARQHDSVVIDRLTEIEAPVLVLTGANDERYRAGAALIASRVRSGRQEVVPGAGHHPHVDAAADVARRITRFLSEI